MGNFCSKQEEELPTRNTVDRKQETNGKTTPLATLEHNYMSLPNKLKATQNSEQYSGLAGLVNLGNTCYMNSALQVLLNTQPLTDYFLSNLHEKDINKTKGKFAKNFAELSKSQWEFALPSITPKSLVSHVYNSCLHFTPGRQHDSQEFLTFFLDKLHEDLNRANHNSTKPRLVKKQALEQMAARSWREYLQNNCSIVVDLFQGQLCSTLKCLRCKGARVKFETFMYLSLPIPRWIEEPTLEECLQEFTREELLSGDQKWVCPNCKVKVNATIKFDIWKVPPILLVHLKRFRYTAFEKTKIRTLVKYKLTSFNLNDQIAASKDSDCTYDLYAKIDHRGSLEAGHYIAGALNRTDGEWYLFDDNYVRKMNDSEKVTPEAYLLCYQKVSVDEYFRQQVDLPHLWPHQVSLSKSRRASEVSDLDNSFVSCEALHESSNIIVFPMLFNQTHK